MAPPATTEPRDASSGGPSYGNFADPFGLVWRMLREGGSLGRAVLSREALAHLAKPLDRMLARRERRLRAAAPPSELPVLLVTGLPRSGTTLVYQALARRLEVSYFTNRNAMFPRSPVAAAGLLESRFRPPAGELRSLYGNTGGLAGPNDGFHVWDHFYGQDRYRAAGPLTPERRGALRRLVDAWVHTTGRPLLNKNNRLCDSLADLAAALPTARFVVVDRHPWQVAQSLLRARRWVQGSERAAWGLGAESVGESSGPLAPVDAVCRQVLSGQSRLAEQIGGVPAERLLRIDYDAFCHAPEEFIGAVLAGSPGVAARGGGARIEPLRPSARWTLSGEATERVRRHLGAGPEGIQA